MHGDITIIGRSANRAGASAKAILAALAAVFIVALFGGGTAQAAETSRQAIRQACADDVRALCAGVIPGGGRIKQCIVENRDRLSDGCKSALLAARPISDP
jgi:hypothetical protein